MKKFVPSGADPYIGLPDGRMIRNTLYGIERDANYLASVIGDDERAATWTPKFIYTAQDRLNVVSEYYKGLKGKPAQPSAYGASEEDELSELYQTAKGGSEASRKGLALLGALGIIVFVVALTPTEKAR